jgi:hypothetical protein
MAPRLVAQRQRQGFLASVTWVRVSVYMSVTPAVSYLSTGLAGYSVGPGISCGARKLTRTPRVTKKKSDRYMTHNTILHRSYRANYSQIHTICFLIFPWMLQWQKRNKNDYEIYVYLRTCLHEYKILGPKYTRTLVCDEPCIERLRCSLLFSQGLLVWLKFSPSNNYFIFLTINI